MIGTCRVQTLLIDYIILLSCSKVLNQRGEEKNWGQTDIYGAVYCPGHLQRIIMEELPSHLTLFPPVALLLWRLFQLF